MWVNLMVGGLCTRLTNTATRLPILCLMDIVNFILDLNSEPCPTAMRCSLFLASSSEVGGEN